MTSVNTTNSENTGAGRGAIIDRLRQYIRQTWQPLTRINYDWKDTAIRASIKRKTGIECTSLELIQAMELEGFNTLYLVNDVYFNIDAPQLVYSKSKDETTETPSPKFTVKQRSQSEVERRKRYRDKQRQKQKYINNQ
jgi:hypothetical protein